MIAPTACPRCSGRLVAERDHHGAFLSCLSCGFEENTDAAGRPLVPIARINGDRQPPVDREATWRRHSVAQRAAWQRKAEGRR